MDWQKLKALLEEGADAIGSDGSHDASAVDEDTGKMYCLGCELEAQIQATLLALDEYSEAQP